MQPFLLPTSPTNKAKTSEPSPPPAIESSASSASTFSVDYVCADSISCRFFPPLISLTGRNRSHWFGSWSSAWPWYLPSMWTAVSLCKHALRDIQARSLRVGTHLQKRRTRSCTIHSVLVAGLVGSFYFGRTQELHGVASAELITSYVRQLADRDFLSK